MTSWGRRNGEAAGRPADQLQTKSKQTRWRSSRVNGRFGLELPTPAEGAVMSSDPDITNYRFDVLVVLEPLVFLAKVPYGSVGHRVAQAPHRVADIGALDHWTVQVAAQERDNGLLEGIEHLRRGLDGLALADGTEDVLDYLVLHGEDIAISHDARGVRRTCDEIRDQESIVEHAAASQVVVTPEVPAALAVAAGRGEVEEDAPLAGAGQAGVDAIRQRLQHVTRSGVEQIAQLLEKELIAGKLGELFLLLDNAAILVENAAQSVEVPGVDRLSKDRNVQKSASVDVRDLPTQSFHQA